MSPRAFPRYSELEAAILRLPVLPKEMWRVTHLVDYLAIMGNIINESSDYRVAPHFRPAPADMADRELNEFARRTEELANKIERGGRTRRAREQLARLVRNFHGPTMTALSNAPPIVVKGKLGLADPSYLDSRFADKLDSDVEISGAELRFWSQVGKRALDPPPTVPGSSAERESFFARYPGAKHVRLEGESPPFQDVGRLPDIRAHNVANELANEYLNLTGRAPKFTSDAYVDKDTVKGSFLDFVTEIFDLLRIDRAALSYASVAAFRLRGRGRKK